LYFSKIPSQSSFGIDLTSFIIVQIEVKKEREFQPGFHENSSICHVEITG